MANDALTAEKLSAIERVQDVADEHLRGGSRTTNIILWDDGDFRVDVVHGYDDVREKIVWRSSTSAFFEGGEFTYLLDTVDCSEEQTTLERRVLDIDNA